MRAYLLKATIPIFTFELAGTLFAQRTTLAMIRDKATGSEGDLLLARILRGYPWRRDPTDLATSIICLGKTVAALQVTGGWFSE